MNVNEYFNKKVVNFYKIDQFNCNKNEKNLIKKQKCKIKIILILLRRNILSKKQCQYL